MYSSKWNLLKLFPSCQLGKSHSLPSFLSDSQAKNAFDLVHSDVCGSAQILSIAGYRYYLVFVDDFTKYIWIYPLWLKSDVIKRIKHQFNKTIKQFSQIKMANTDAFINIVITWG